LQKKPQRDFIFDFQSTDFESDRKAAERVVSAYQKIWNLPDDVFIIGKPAPFMGWSLAKLFLSLELVAKLYDNNSSEIERQDRTLEDAFLAWLIMQLRAGGCKALLKYSEEMMEYVAGRASASIPRGFW